MQKTIKNCIRKRVENTKRIIYRYLYKDDFGKPKTTFLICAFWYVEALAAVGRLDDAQREFANLLQYSNHLLLFSEDVDENDGSQWGNFPQAYSHVGLMNAGLSHCDEIGQANIFVKVFCFSIAERNLILAIYPPMHKGPAN